MRLRGLLTLPALVLVWLGCAADRAFGQADGLKLHRSLAPLSAEARERAPVYVFGDRLEGTTEEEMEVRGNAELRQHDVRLQADRIRYFPDVDEVEATGNVRLNAQGDRVTGPRLRMRVSDLMGVFNEPKFNLAPRLSKLRTGDPVEMRGEASTMRFEGEDRYRLENGMFTSCKPGVDDWYMRAREMDLDFGEDLGVARGARLTFKGITTPALPWVEFPLSNGRKTGFLPPAFGAQGKVGAELFLPFYWNVAPNRDVTLTPRYMSKRGLQLLTEARYLEPTQNGVFRYEYLPKDQVLGENRYAFAWLHTMLTPGLAVGQANVNKVSDDAYFRELSGRLSIATQVYLPREGFIQSATSPWWNVTARIQRFQTLQEPAALTDPTKFRTPPYERVPQLLFNGLRYDVGGFDLNGTGEFVAFDHPTLQTGRRSTAYPSMSYPLISPGAYLTPKVGVHLTHYGLPSGPTVGDTTLSRSVPIASLDSGLVFERNVMLRGLDVIQTLEPRVYYLYVPFRSQDAIPVFDTAIADFNYAQIFSENFYVGGDRISDANQLTLALTSRLIRGDNGQETLRALIAQRHYFAEQRVGLPGTQLRTERLSSVLVGLAGQVLPRTTLEATAQLDSNTLREQRLTVSARYQPARDKILNVSYRYLSAALNVNPLQVPGTQPEPLRQIDVSGTWPITSNWKVLARQNYSMVSRKAVESLMGIEYNAGCWIVRAVTQQFVTATGEQTRLFFVQLELDGFSRIGSNPFEALRRNIPGYSGGPITPATSSRTFDLYE
jgi:LPS-assembly protein